MRLKMIICLLLGVITLAIYWPVRHFRAIYYDDLYFVVDVPSLSAGIRHGLAWAMTEILAANWHPVTNLSFLLTHQFFGYNPGVEHLVNVYFHAANAILLFLVLVQLTGATWRSAVAAAIFAWHPLRVESVAWIAERKDVLFVFFMLLALLCYARYAQGEMKGDGAATNSTDGTTHRPCYWWNGYYFLALMFFVLSLMSKAMVVTLPFVLLLLDFWPLQRFERVFGSQGTDRAALKRLLIEKIPFFALTVFFSALTFRIQKAHSAVAPLESIGIGTRLENAASSYVNYLGQLFWPSKLAVIYPYPIGFDISQVICAGLLLLAVSALCVLELSRRPYLAVGWFWYLGTMVPVIGLVQVGNAAMADRYTYIPLIGPVVSLIWLVSEWAQRSVSNMFRGFLLAMAAVVVAACLISTRIQLKYWQNTTTLLERDIAVAPDNGYVLPHFLLAMGLTDQGRWREAAGQFQIALALNRPEVLFVSHFRLAKGLEQLGYYRQAEGQFEEALQVEPSAVEVMNDLAWSLATCPDANARDGKRAVQLGEQACELTHYQVTLFIGTLAAAFAEAGRFDDAVATAQKAIANAKQQGETGLAEKNQQLLKLYLAHKAYHEN